MRVLIIEDEAAAYNNIRNILKQIDSSIEILANLDTVTSSVVWLREHPAPDLIFLDIQLADGSSFSIFECVTINVPIIFTTAYDEFAINAFQVNSIDYLLKPITVEGVRKALEKHDRITNANMQSAIQNINKYLNPSGYSHRVLVPYKDKIIPVKIPSIAYFYNTAGITYLFTIDGKSYRIDKSLDNVMETLDSIVFNRANRQFIVSKNAIVDITIWFDNRLLVNLVTEPPEKVFISKNRAAEFKSWFSS